MVFQGNEANPIVDFSPGITYQFRLWINATNILAPVVLMEGEHDGFPAYEVYVDMTTIYTHDPRDSGQKVDSLFPPAEWLVPLRAKTID